MTRMDRTDWDAVAERVRAAREQDHAEQQPAETTDQINRRMFEGDDLPDIAARMFRI